MWSDNETEVDFLGIGHLVAGVGETVRSDVLVPVTVGVYGDWGSGKSSLLRMVCNELRKEESTLVVEFNGWQFEGYEDAKSALMGTVLDEVLARQLRLAKLSDKAKAIGQTLLKRVNWFRLVGLAVKGAVTLTTGIPAFGICDVLAVAGKLDVDEAEKLVKEAPEEDKDPRKTVREFKKDFKALLDETDIKRLVIVIDDLDRCLPTTVIETLEAIRLFLFVDKTAFIIGADEEHVRYAVNVRFPESRGTSLEVGRAYLEKLIQVPVRVPPLSSPHVERYMMLLFTAFHLGTEKAGKLVKTLSRGDLLKPSALRITEEQLNAVDTSDHRALLEDLALCGHIADVLARGLDGNPRQVKRFLNAMLLRVRMAKAEEIDLQHRVLAKLMLLEYFRPEAFRQLLDQLNDDGLPSGLSALEGASAKSEAPGAVGREGDDVVDKERAFGVSHWPEEAWLSRWLALEPRLAQVDLRNYFYFSREKLGSVSFAVKQLSPKAQLVFAGLTSTSEAKRSAALTEAKALAPLDASGLLETFAQHVRKADGVQGTNSPLATLIELGERRPELLSEVLLVLSGIPEENVGTNIPLHLFGLELGGAEKGLRDKLVARWAESKKNAKLAAAAKMAPEQDRKKKGRK